MVKKYTTFGKEEIVDLLNQQNGAHVPFEDLMFFKPATVTGVRNSQVELAALPNTRYAGGAITYFNRLNLSAIFKGIPTKLPPTSAKSRFDKFNEFLNYFGLPHEHHRNAILNPDDLIADPIVEFKASADAMAYTGAVTVIYPNDDFIDLTEVDVDGRVTISPNGARSIVTDSGLIDFTQGTSVPLEYHPITKLPVGRHEPEAVSSNRYLWAADFTKWTAARTSVANTSIPGAFVGKAMQSITTTETLTFPRVTVTCALKAGDAVMQIVAKPGTTKFLHGTIERQGLTDNMTFFCDLETLEVAAGTPKGGMIVRSVTARSLANGCVLLVVKVTLPSDGNYISFFGPSKAFKGVVADIGHSIYADFAMIENRSIASSLIKTTGSIIDRYASEFAVETYDYHGCHIYFSNGNRETYVFTPEQWVFNLPPAPLDWAGRYVQGIQYLNKTIDMLTEQLDPRVKYTGPDSHAVYGRAGNVWFAGPSEWPVEYIDGVPVGRHEPEPRAINLVSSNMLTWGTYNLDIDEDSDEFYKGSAPTDTVAYIETDSVSIDPGQPMTCSVFLRPKDQFGVQGIRWGQDPLAPLAVYDFPSGSINTNSSEVLLARMTTVNGLSQTISTVATDELLSKFTMRLLPYWPEMHIDGNAASMIYPQCEVGSIRTSPIKGDGVSTTREAASVSILKSNHLGCHVYFNTNEIETHYFEPSGDAYFPLPLSTRDWGTRYITKIVYITDISELPANHLKRLYPNTGLNAWNMPSGAAEALMQDQDPPVPGVVNHCGWLMTYNYAIDEVTWNSSWEMILEELGISRIEDAVGVAVGDMTEHPTFDSLMLGLFEAFGPWVLEPGDNKMPFNIYGMEIVSYSAITLTENQTPAKGNIMENIRRAEDVKYVMEFKPASNYYGNVHGHVTMYVY